MNEFQQLTGEVLANLQLGKAAEAQAAAVQATALVHKPNGMLYQADQLSTANLTALDSSWKRQRSAGARHIEFFALAEVALLAAIGFSWYVVARKTHRLVNIGLAAAVGVALAGGAVGILAMSQSGAAMRVAKQDAFGSVVSLLRARSFSADANGDESRYLTNSAEHGQHERAFLANQTQLAQLSNAATLDAFAKGLHEVDSALKNKQPVHRFSGVFGDALANITFKGETEAAARTIAAYTRYIDADAKMRQLAAGSLDDAKRFTTSHAPGDSNFAFDEFDAALSDWAALNQKVFDDKVSSAAGSLSARLPIILALLGMMGSCAFAGIWRRLDEYKV